MKNYIKNIKLFIPFILAFQFNSLALAGSRESKNAIYENDAAIEFYEKCLVELDGAKFVESHFELSTQRRDLKTIKSSLRHVKNNFKAVEKKLKRAFAKLISARKIEETQENRIKLDYAIAKNFEQYGSLHYNLIQIFPITQDRKIELLKKSLKYYQLSIRRYIHRNYVSAASPSQEMVDQITYELTELKASIEADHLNESPDGDCVTRTAIHADSAKSSTLDGDQDVFVCESSVKVNDSQVLTSSPDAEMTAAPDAPAQSANVAIMPVTVDRDAEMANVPAAADHGADLDAEMTNTAFFAAHSSDQDTGCATEASSTPAARHDADHGADQNSNIQSNMMMNTATIATQDTDMINTPAPTTQNAVSISSSDSKNGAKRRKGDPHRSMKVGTAPYFYSVQNFFGDLRLQLILTCPQSQPIIQSRLRRKTKEKVQKEKSVIRFEKEII